VSGKVLLIPRPRRFGKTLNLSEKALESAVRQIEEKEYKAKAQAGGYRNIIQFDVVFDGKRVRIKTLDF
jgi:hypothetical protein